MKISSQKLKEELVDIACAEGYDVVGTDFERKIVLPNGAPIACMYGRGINFYMDALLYYRDAEFNFITTMQRTYIDHTLCTSVYAAAGEVDNEITLKRNNEEADKLVDIMLVNGGVLNIPHTTKALFMHPAFGKTHMIGHMDVHTSSIYTFTEWCKVIKKRFKKACPVVIVQAAGADHRCDEGDGCENCKNLFHCSIMFNISFLGVSSRCHNIDAKLPEILHQKLKYFEIPGVQSAT